MPIGSSKVGVLGAGLVPGGSVTFNTSGTWAVPPGVKKVSITGKGGTGNPGVAGNPGNPGNPGTGGAGGGGGAGRLQNSNFGNACIRGGFAMRGVINNPTYRHPQSTLLGDTNNSILNAPTPVAIEIASIGGQSTPCSSPGVYGQAGQGGISGNAGTAGQAGSAGTAGNPSSALGNTFPGGAGGNAPPGGAAGNAGTGGGGGNGGRSWLPTTNHYPDPTATTAGGTGGTGGGNGGQGFGGLFNCANPLYPQVSPSPPDKSFILFGGAGGAGAGSVNSGQSGCPSGNTIWRQSTYPGLSAPRADFKIGGSGNITGGIPGDPDISNFAPGLSPSTMGGFGGTYNPFPGPGSRGGASNFVAWSGQIDAFYGFPGASAVPSNSGTVRLNIPSYSPVPAVPGDLFRSGGGGALGIGFGVQCWASRQGRAGGGGGGGGRGNAGNAGGNSPTISGSAGTPQTFNCVPVTPGTPTPITVGGPTGGQIVISWNPQ